MGSLEELDQLKPMGQGNPGGFISCRGKCDTAARPFAADGRGEATRQTLDHGRMRRMKRSGPWGRWEGGVAAGGTV